MKLPFKDKPLHYFPDNATQEQANGYGINYMHNPDIDIVGPIWIFLSKEVHIQM